jgi:hypothetical protein
MDISFKKSREISLYRDKLPAGGNPSGLFKNGL